jgi:hypothetical protein
MRTEECHRLPTLGARWCLIKNRENIGEHRHNTHEKQFEVRRHMEERKEFLSKSLSTSVIYEISLSRYSLDQSEFQRGIYSAETQRGGFRVIARDSSDS